MWSLLLRQKFCKWRNKIAKPILKKDVADIDRAYAPFIAFFRGVVEVTTKIIREEKVL